MVTSDPGAAGGTAATRERPEGTGLQESWENQDHRGNPAKEAPEESWDGMVTPAPREILV